MNISFFIPAYNCAKTIAESVVSILETNFQQGDELIIVNDCATDDTAYVLDVLQEQYPLIQVINHKRNKGGAAARNTAVENAKNELLFCLDSDNVLAENSIRPLKEYLISTNADVCSFEEMRYFNSENKLKTTYVWKFLPETALADYMADTRNPGSSGNYLFTKASWKKAGTYPEYAGALDTWGFGFNQLATGSKMVSLPNSFYFHRYGKESYYIRDMNSRNMSLAALQIVLPHKDLFFPEDFNYITSEEGRYNWFDSMKDRPIKIKDNPMGRMAKAIYMPQKRKRESIISLPKRIASEILKTIM